MLEYYKEISYYLLRLTKDKDLARDLTQETYAKALEIDKKAEKTTIQKAYLYKIAYSLVIDKARKNKKISYTSFEEEQYSIPKKECPEEILSDEKREQKLKKCISTLSKRNKQAFVLHVYKGLTRKEISEIMGISVNAVEKNITRATLKIKEQMKKEY
ncbi:RNA polymerase subunit sigma [Arcobacter sp. F155]|uniref:RNA polymerase sigma factor n=1 Tax=unclassified Arcobacter TaxID=2593671 RepID=UPI00100BD12A|nr:MULTISPECIES: RNA polymerase sigma factor [unclassified Arcobacter]RXJ75322.1 RNA polymerase subunit sigma [Arcobacter sp. F155]RXK02207.1 RNA polymerase subunit sigma [Arcobacter sp. CECT 8989]